MIDPHKFDLFTRSYIEAALWSSNDENDVPLDSNYSVMSISQEALARIVEDCQKFQEMFPEFDGYSGPYKPEEMAGHDFWLTRNGHGCGFWDGDWAKKGKKYCLACKQFPHVDLYVGDDGLIYLMAGLPRLATD